MDATATASPTITIVKITDAIFTGEPSDDYHASSAISFHRLKDFDPTMGGSPAQFYMRHMQGMDRPDRDAYRIGRATHALVLEGQEAFDERYVVAPEGMKISQRPVKVGETPTVNLTTRQREIVEAVAAAGCTLDSIAEAARLGKTRADVIENLAASGHLSIGETWESQQTREIIKAQEHETINHMAASVRGHPEISEWLRDGWPEVTVRLIDPETGIPVQIRPDHLGSQLNRFIDLKTVDAFVPSTGWNGRAADPLAARWQHFRRQAESLGYDRQVAWYTWVLSLATSIPMEELSHRVVAVEKSPPWGCQAFHVTPEKLAAAHTKNMTALGQLKVCIDSNDYPDLTSVDSLPL